ncbi:MAG: N-acetyltransferase [Muribaculaceae bacterium]|nr:N-acetyltransferase [Muribaculaceae bacterium]
MTDKDEIVVKALKPTRRELLDYIHFGIDLYKDNPYFVPPLVVDELATLDPRKNPASEVCESQSFLALRGGKTVGRITAIINNDANRRYGEKSMRFGFVDFIDDAAVVDALFDAAARWGRSRGAKAIIGPMGFTDMDHEGMLVEGFEEAGTMATIYNYPYYPRHMERMGFVKDVDWVEYRIKVPDAVPEKMLRIADIVRRKFGLHSVHVSSRKELKEKYGHEFFHLINEDYAELYGFTPLTERMIDHYVDSYLGILRLDDLSIIVDADGRLAGAGIAMPSLTAALQRCGGKMLPTGWWHLLRAVQGNGVDVVDLLLVAVRKDLQGKGVNSLLFCELIPRFKAHGYREAESNLELEGNESVQKQWEYFERRQHRRRRAWRKEL